MSKIEDLFSVTELLDYTKTRKFKEHKGASLFPAKKLEALEVKMIKGASNLPVSANIHAFDTETEMASREGAKYSIEELALIKRKFRLSEKDILILNQPRNSIEEAQTIRRIYNDIDTLVKSINTRIEALRMEALSTGKLVINENNVQTVIDYGCPSSHKTNLNWSGGTPTILEDIYDMMEKIKDDTGITPSAILTSSKILRIILKDESIRKGVLGVNSDKFLTKTELNTFLTLQELPPIETYDEKYRIELKTGKFVTKRFLDENSFILMPEGKMGETLYGLTAEELELRNKPGIDISSIGNIIIEQYYTPDPVGKWIKAVTTALPSFPYADQVFIATIQ